MYGDMTTATASAQAGASSIGRLQAIFALVGLAVVALIAIAIAAGGRQTSIPAWLTGVIVGGVGVVTLFTVHFWRIRPVPPGWIKMYGRITFSRLFLASIPAIVGFTLFLIVGHVPAVIIGAIGSIISLTATIPTATDYERHQELWDEKLPIPRASLWGTADPQAIPPWEDPDGGHGHGFHEHGLH